MAQAVDTTARLLAYNGGGGGSAPASPWTVPTSAVKGDCIQLTDAVLTGAVLTSASANFKVTDVNKSVLVAGAGATAGSPASGGPLSTTILSWQSVNQVTLAASAVTNVGPCVFTGYITANGVHALLHVTGVTSGAISAGQYVAGVGVSPTTIIGSQAATSGADLSTWNLPAAQIVASIGSPIAMSTTTPFLYATDDTAAVQAFLDSCFENFQAATIPPQLNCYIKTLPLKYGVPNVPGKVRIFLMGTLIPGLPNNHEATLCDYYYGNLLSPPATLWGDVHIHFLGGQIQYPDAWNYTGNGIPKKGLIVSNTDGFTVSRPQSTGLNLGSFNCQVYNSFHGIIDGGRTTAGEGTGEDGLHFYWNASDITVNGMYIRSGDDATSMTAEGSDSLNGTIQRITFTGCVLEVTGFSASKVLLSNTTGASLIQKIKYSNCIAYNYYSSTYGPAIAQNNGVAEGCVINDISYEYCLFDASLNGGGNSFLDIQGVRLTNCKWINNTVSTGSTLVLAGCDDAEINGEIELIGAPQVRVGGLVPVSIAWLSGTTANVTMAANTVLTGIISGDYLAIGGSIIPTNTGVFQVNGAVSGSGGATPIVPISNAQATSSAINDAAGPFGAIAYIANNSIIDTSNSTNVRGHITIKGTSTTTVVNGVPVTAGYICNSASGGIFLRGTLYTITGASYTSATGLVTLTFGSSLGLAPGTPVVVTGITGTGSFAAANGTFVAAVGTTGTTVTYQIAASLTLTLTTSGSPVLSTATNYKLEFDLHNLSGGSAIVMTALGSSNIKADAWNCGGTGYLIQENNSCANNDIHDSHDFSQRYMRTATVQGLGSRHWNNKGLTTDVYSSTLTWGSAATSVTIQLPNTTYIQDAAGITPANLAVFYGTTALTVTAVSVSGTTMTVTGNAPGTNTTAYFVVRSLNA